MINIAGINSYSSTSVSGYAHTLDKFVKYFREYYSSSGDKIKIIDLPISIPGHCEIMNDAQIEYKKLFDKIEINDPKIPIISFVDTKPKTTRDEVIDSLVNAFTSTVDFRSWVQYCIDNGMDFVEFSERGSMTRLIKNIKLNYAKVQ